VLILAIVNGQPKVIPLLVIVCVPFLANAISDEEDAIVVVELKIKFHIND